MPNMPPANLGHGRDATTPYQLKMLMTPREILHDARMNEDSDVHSISDVGHTMVSKYKIEEAKANGLYDSVKAGGVKKPVNMEHTSPKDAWRDEDAGRAIINGHHRFFSQADIDADQLMPVVHHDVNDQAARRDVDWTNARQDPTGEGTYKMKMVEQRMIDLAGRPQPAARPANGNGLPNWGNLSSQMRNAGDGSYRSSF